MSGSPSALPPTFLTAQWRYLAMLTYEIDPRLLVDRVPAGTELDAFRGRTFVSLVGFRFLDTRIWGIAIPFHRDFDEVNLRFYVRRRSDDGDWRRGVVFIKEVVPRRAIAAAARLLYNENYVTCPMHASAGAPANDGPGHAEYRWRDGGRDHRIRVTFRAESALPDPESEEAYISEHYWGYVRERDNATLEYRVEHPRWRVWPASDVAVELDALRVYGPAFADCLSRGPVSAFVADGSRVEVRRGVRIA